MRTNRLLTEQTVMTTLFNIKGARKCIRQAESLLPMERYLKMQAYLKEEDRLRSLAASLLLIKATRGCGVYYTDFGKPYAEGLSFNISHLLFPRRLS